MRQFVKYIGTIAIISIIIMAGIFAGITFQKKGVFHPSYQSIIADKYRMLQKTNDKKIIVVAGSSSSFGLDQEMLEKETGYKVVNLGLHAGFGHLFHSELAKENINPGDIVLLAYEYGWKDGFKHLGQDLIMSGIDENIDMYKHIPVRRWPDFIGYLFKYAEQKNNYLGPTDDYSREAFDEENAQMILLRDYALSDYSVNADSYGTITVEDNKGEVRISENSIEYLRSFKEYIEDSGASVYFVSSPILYDSVTCDPDQFHKLAELEEEVIGIPYISDPELYMFPADLMSNAINHCNSDGEKIRTGILIDDLKRSGVIEPDKLTGEKKTIKGETVVLVDSLPKRLLNKPTAALKVYYVDGKGETTLYREGKDYIVDYDRGTIRRTQSSAIPNYRDHNVLYKSGYDAVNILVNTGGKFTYASDADGRNPESNRRYQIRIDYEYDVTEKEADPILSDAAKLSRSVQDKIKNGKSISIMLCGDGIGAGADTDGRDTFINYLSRALSDYYGIGVNAENISVEGQSRKVLEKKMGDIISKHPDIVLIELGMNDHCGEDASSDENVLSYKTDIDKAVKTLKSNGIDVILVGFFQQNMTWDMENVEATKRYNEALKEVSEENDVYFADVYSTFNSLGSRKHLSSDVMTDYIHHPSEWGHKVYFSSIIGAFDINNSMKPSDFPDFIYVN